jgi:predicted PurR-regulated permease PerM
MSRIRSARQSLRLPGGSSAALILLVGLVLLYFAWRLARPIALFVVAAAIAAALVPVVNRLALRMPRTLAVILIYLILLVLLVLIFWGIVPPLIEQFQAAITSLPDLVKQAEQTINRWDFLPDTSFIDLISPTLTTVSAVVVALPIALGAAFFEMVMIFVVSVYLLLEAPKMHRFLLSLFPEAYQPRVDEVSIKMANAMGGFVQGTILTAAIVGLLTYIGMLVLNVRFPLMLGLLAGVLEIIPNLGPILAAIPMVLIALVDSPTKALLVILFVTVLQQLESHVIMPNVMRSQIQISPLLVIVAVLAGGALGGLLGIIAAIPLVAALSVFTVEVIAPAIRTSLENWVEGRQPPLPASLPEDNEASQETITNSS